MSIFGSRRFHNVESQLAERGITFDREGTLTGKPRGLTIDAGNNPEFNKSTLAESRSAIARFYDIPESQVHQINGNNGGRFRIQMGDLDTKASRSLAFTSLKLLDDGRILGAMNKRVVSKFFNLPSLFKPLDRARASTENRVQTRLERLARERTRAQSKKQSRLPPKYSEQMGRVRDKLSGHARAVSAALFLTGAACDIRDVANAIPIVNYGAIVIPSVVEAMDKQAVGSQVQAGHDVDLVAMGDVVEALKDDEGNTIWEAKSLNALTYGGVGQGQDIDVEYKQAFASDTTGVGILDTLADSGATGAACSTAGRLVQLVAGLALLAVPGPGWGARAAIGTASAVATGAAVAFLQNLAIDHLTEDPVKFFGGPKGGNLLAHAAWAGAGMTARAMGGVPLDNTNTVAALDDLDERETREFQQRSLFARIFDANDYRSVMAAAVRNASGTTIQDVSTTVASFINPNTVISRLASSLTPKALAQEEAAYDWAFPLYGIPQEVLDNPAYQDPYENADAITAVFDNDTGEDYINRAFVCFGSNITKTTNGWDAVPEAEVNPNEETYLNADCGDMSDENWVRTMLFVFDTSIVSLIDCYEGDQGTCQRVGFGQETPDVSTGATLGDVQCPAVLEPHPSEAGYYRMPDAPNGEYSVYAVDSKRWGSRAVICATYSVALAYNEAMEGRSKMKVGNMNTPLNQPSVSHRWGTAVDHSAAGEIQAASHNKPEKGTYSSEATVLLGKLWADTGMLRNIWWCPPSGDGSISEILTYAQTKGIEGTVKCIDGHSDHFHVDIKNEYRLQVYP